MSTHYLTCLPIAILGGFLVVVSQAFGPAVLGWVAVGVAIGVITIAVLAQLDHQRGRVQRVIDAGIVALGALLIVFGLVGSGTAVAWAGGSQPRALSKAMSGELRMAPPFVCQL